MTRVRFEVPSLEWVNWNRIRETLPGGPAVIEVTVEDVTTTSNGFDVETKDAMT